jgi:AraC-like DNA-binding protein
MIAMAEERPLYLPELATELGVSERTLRQCCHEHFGVGPKRYLMLRRMHLARKALRGATAQVESVTNIATQYGFWELGRFAVNYQHVFGESPSTTLRRPPVSALPIWTKTHGTPAGIA